MICCGCRTLTRSPMAPISACAFAVAASAGNPRQPVEAPRSSASRTDATTSSGFTRLVGSSSIADAIPVAWSSSFASVETTAGSMARGVLAAVADRAGGRRVRGQQRRERLRRDHPGVEEVAGLLQVRRELGGRGVPAPRRGDEQVLRALLPGRQAETGPEGERAEPVLAGDRPFGARGDGDRVRHARHAGHGRGDERVGRLGPDRAALHGDPAARAGRGELRRVREHGLDAGLGQGGEHGLVERAVRPEHAGLRRDAGQLLDRGGGRGRLGDQDRIAGTDPRDGVEVGVGEGQRHHAPAGQQGAQRGQPRLRGLDALAVDVARSRCAPGNRGSSSRRWPAGPGRARNTSTSRGPSRRARPWTRP